MMRALALAVVLAATAMTFAPVTSNGFVNWDDAETIVANTALQQMATLAGDAPLLEELGELLRHDHHPVGAMSADHANFVCRHVCLSQGNGTAATMARTCSTDPRPASPTGIMRCATVCGRMACTSSGAT